MLGSLMGFGGVAVDVGFLEYRQQVQQTATDAAALGGAQALARTSCSSAVVGDAAATADATSNGFTNGGGISVKPNVPPMSGPYAGNSCAISVQITNQNAETFFARLFGFPTGMQESTQAVAAVSANGGTGCIYLLSPTIVQNINGDNIHSPQCGAYVNNTVNFNGSTIDLPYIGYAGGTPNENGTTFTEATPQPMLPIADPCPTIPGCNYLANNPPPTSSCTSYNVNGYNGPLTAGCYNSLNVNGSNVTMSGLYILNGTSNFNGSTINATNATIYVTANGTPPNFNGLTVKLSPPSSGNDVGVAYYQVPSNTAAPNFNGNNSNYSGLMYAPNATGVNFNGVDGGYLVLVFGSVNFNGSQAQDFASPPPGGALVTKAVIVQ
jgi:Putative Flp pilus-assembly TadE/G-like